jgi:flagellar basal body P-ring formation protein FlgA
MKQASNSLLILNSTPFNALLGFSSLPRDNSERQTRHLTPFIIRRENRRNHHSVLLVSCLPRSIVRSRLGEGRIRSLFQRLAGFFLCFCLCFPLAMGSPKADDFTIVLKADAAVQSEVILLKDVAELTSQSSDRIQKLERIELGSSPAFGSIRTLSRYQIAEAVQNATGMLPGGGIAGAPAVQIRLQGRSVDPKEIMELVKAHLLKTGNWNDSEIRIDSIGNLNGIELPPGKCILQIASGGLTIGRRNVLAPIEILQNGRSLRSFWLTVGVSINAEIITAAKKIALGDSITPDAVLKKFVEISDLRASYARNIEAVIGKIASKTISSGEFLTNEAVADPFLVKHGDAVNLRLERNGLVLTSTVRAEQDGRLGQIIRVRNMDFSTVLRAQVTGRAQVILQ